MRARAEGRSRVKKSPRLYVDKLGWPKGVPRIANLDDEPRRAKSGAALADVRHVSVPEWLWGTWAPSAELCRDDKSIIVMSEKSYVTSQANCTVQWLTETAAADGPIYSAHMRCSRPSTSEHETESNRIIVPKDNGQLSVGAPTSMTSRATSGARPTNDYSTTRRPGDPDFGQRETGPVHQGGRRVGFASYASGPYLRENAAQPGRRSGGLIRQKLRIPSTARRPMRS